MANTKQLKFDATAPLYAMVGAGDLAVEFARTAANDVQARISKVELEPKALRHQARSLVDETVSEASEAFDDLATRGKVLVSRIRRQQATQDAKAAGNTTVAKAKTTRTQTAKSAKSSKATVKGAATRVANDTAAAADTGKTAAKTTTTAAKNTGKTAKRNVKATGTSARKTASAAARATADGASKVGD